MRLKIRSPSGTHVLTLLDTATIADLIAEIRSTTDLGGDLDIKYGYPPRPLPLALHPTSTPLLQLPIKLQGEQLIVSAGTNSGGSVRGSGGSVVHPVEKQDGEKQSGGGAVYPAPTSSSSSSSSSAPFSFTTGQMAPNKPLALARAAPKFNKDDPPDVALPGRGTVVLRVMEDDNSCLFRALSYVMTGSMISVEELRQLVAGTIQEAPETYSKAVLEQHPDSYCEWIKMDSSWGGGIELGILADWFEMEICTIDVATGNMIRFNEGKAKRVVVVYSGIHYDALALSPIGYSVHDSDKDKLVFDKEDDQVLVAALELCRKLKQKHYFTDTKNFELKCKICNKGLKGEKEALEHARTTGHQDFGES